MMPMGKDLGLTPAKKAALVSGCLAPSGSTAVPSFASFALPIIKRSTPRLTAHSLASIQPMTAPNSKLFYMDFDPETYRWARPGAVPRPGAVVIGTRGGERPKRTVYLVAAVKNARVELTSGHGSRSVSVADIEPAGANT